MDTRSSFREELDAVRADLVHMAGRVHETIPRGTTALLSNDLQAARSLIAGDDEIDLTTIEIEERCYQILALQQPVAHDLRAVVTALWLSAEIERTADLMTNVAKAAHRLVTHEISPRFRGLIEQMGEQAGLLFGMALDSYVEESAELAGVLDEVDDVLDDLHREFITAVLESEPADEAGVKAVVQLALIGRYYERIGDHAVNIGERVHYLVTGWMPEHAGAARARQLAIEQSHAPV